MAEAKKDWRGKGKRRKPKGASGSGRPKPADLPTEPITLVAGSPAHGGAVVARGDDGRTVFLRGALPGEQVRAKVSADHKKYLWADTVEVLERSPDRVDHVWPEPIEIGESAADLGFVSAPAQLQWKSDVLADQLRRVGGPALAARVAELYPDGVQVVATSGEASSQGEGGRRTRVQLTAGKDGRLGMRPYRTNDVVPVDSIPLAVPAIADVTTLDPNLPGSPWKGKWAPGERVSLVAPSAGPALVVTERGVYQLADGQPFKEKATWEVTADGRTETFKVTPGGFWQTDKDAPTELVERVLEAAQARPGQIALELYSGAGLLSRFLADKVGPSGQLLTLEGDEAAVADAGENLVDALEDDFAVLYQGSIDAGSVAELADAADRDVDLVVLDPPRKGAGKDVAQAVAKTGADKVVLVSCDPAAAARDLRDFADLGFELESLVGLDLFPHTHHFETVAELSRKPEPAEES